MPNVLTTILPKILARSLLVLREQASMPRLVNSDWGMEAAKKGKTIDVPISGGAQPVTDVVPSNTPPVPPSITPNQVQITLENWKETSFHLTDKEMGEIDKSAHFMPLAMQESVRAMANTINADLLNQYKGIYGYTGTAGVTPFATDVLAATDARKKLHQQKAFPDNRRMVLDFDAEANALALSQFSDADKVGTPTVRIEGQLGRKYGFDTITNSMVPTHIAGTAVAITVGTGGALLDATAVNLLDAGAGTLVDGDIIDFAGDTQTYSVVGNYTLQAAVDTLVSISPNLQIALAGGEVVTKRADHVVNLAFHRDAFAYAARPLEQSSADMQLGSLISSMTDDETGVSLRLEVSRQHRQVVWAMDMLWGSKLVRPELATRIAG